MPSLDLETLIEICKDFFEQRGFKVYRNHSLHSQIMWSFHIYAVKNKEKIALDIRTTSSMPPLWPSTLLEIRRRTPTVKVFFAIPREKITPKFKRDLDKLGIGLFCIDKNRLQVVINQKIKIVRGREKTVAKTPYGRDVSAVVLHPGSPYLSWLKIGEILKPSKIYVKIIDPYATEETLQHLLHTNEKVNLRFITAFSFKRQSYKPIFYAACKQFKKERQKFSAVECSSTDIHDRYFINEKEVWMMGPSIKNAGTKFGTIARIDDSQGKREIMQFFDDLWSKKFIRKIC